MLDPSRNMGRKHNFYCVVTIRLLFLLKTLTLWPSSILDNSNVNQGSLSSPKNLKTEGLLYNVLIVLILNGSIVTRKDAGVPW